MHSPAGSLISPQAIIHPSAKLAEDVQVGPWTLIGPDVDIGSGTVIASHVVIKGPTRIGRDNQIFQFASVGEACQDKKYQGEPTRLEIGDRNIIRESCTLHRGTVQDQGVTKIGDDNLLMAYVHIAHDCVVGNHSIFVNNASLAGHVKVADGVILGGFTAIRQFCTIGAYSLCSGGSIVVKDIPAFVTVAGNPCSARGLNTEGMRRRQYAKSIIATLRQAYKILYLRGLPLKTALEQLESLDPHCEELQLFIQSIKASTQLGIVGPAR
jgi:UDP-N-acetylglucosamine acyltransferase